MLKDLAGKDADGAVLDLKLNYPGEWFTYAFSPLLQSAGADLIDRSDYQKATNTLNSPAAVTAMAHLQSWLKSGYVDANVDDGPQQKEKGEGRVERVNGNRGDKDK